jgi:hypothetical protein
VLPKYCFGNPDLLVGTRLITLSRNGVPVAEKNTGTPQKNEPERRSGHQKKNRNDVPVRSGPFRTLKTMRFYSKETFSDLKLSLSSGEKPTNSPYIA